MHDTTTQSPLLTIKEASSYLGISERSLHRHKKAGEIRFVPIGGSIRFRKSTLDAWIESQERVATEA